MTDPYKIPMYTSLAPLIIDDLVLASGVTHMHQLGGPGPYATSGAAVFAGHVPLPARVGHDLHSDKLVQQLHTAGAIVTLDHVALAHNTPRAWTLFDESGQRTFVWRTPVSEYEAHFRVSATDVGDVLSEWSDTLRGVHLLANAERMVGLVHAVRQVVKVDECVLLWEPSPPCYTVPGAHGLFETAVALVDVFSPSWEEGKVLLPPEKVTGMQPVDALQLLALFRGMAEDTTIVLRLGEDGCMVLPAGAAVEEVLHMPAVPDVHPVDVTGAGNAFCGGFLVGFVESGRDAREAALHGTVSASFALEQVGLPDLSDREKTRAVAQARLNAYRTVAETFHSEMTKVCAKLAKKKKAPKVVTTGHKVLRKLFGPPIRREPLSFKLLYTNEPKLDAWKRGEDEEPAAPPEAKSAIRLVATFKEDVKVLDIGRFSGKVKLLLGFLSSNNALPHFVGYTTFHSPSQFVTTLYFDHNPMDAAVTAFGPVIPGDHGEQIVRNLFDKYTSAGGGTHAQAFQGDFGMSLELTLEKTFELLAALGLRAGASLNPETWPPAAQHVLTFLERVCHSFSCVSLHTETRNLSVVTKGLQIDAVARFLEGQTGDHGYDFSEADPVDAITSAVFERHPGLLAQLEFLAIFSALPVLGVGAGLVGVQQALMYHPTREMAAYPDGFGHAYKDLLCTTSDSITLRSWLLTSRPFEAGDGGEVATIVFFHGNAGNISHRLQGMSRLWVTLEGRFNLVLAEYRGYGENEGRPHEAGLIEDARAVLKALEGNVVLFGRSLGGAVAAALARDVQDRPGEYPNVRLRGIVLENTFTSVADMMGPLLASAVQSWVRDRWPTVERVETLTLPALFISGRSDQLIPPFQMNALYDTYGSSPSLGPDAQVPKQFVPFPLGAHNNTSLQEGYHAAIAGFLMDHVV